MRRPVQLSTVIAATTLVLAVGLTPAHARAESDPEVPPEAAAIPADPYLPPPEPEPAGGTQMKSPAMVGVGSVFLILGGIGTVGGFGTMVAGLGGGHDSATYVGIGGLAVLVSLPLALGVGLPLVVVGAKRRTATVSIGPGTVGIRATF